MSTPAKFGMPRITAERAAEHVHAFAVDIHSAATAVGQCNDAVDVGKGVQRAGLERVGDAVRYGRGAIDRRQNADIVARRHAPVGTNDALKRCRRIDVARRPGIGAEGVIARELAHRQIVQMHMLARRDRAFGEANDLVVALDWRAGSKRARCDFVPGWNQPRHLDVLVEQHRPRDELLSRDDHVVVGMQANGQRGLGQHEICSNRMDAILDALPATAWRQGQNWRHD